MGRPRKNKVDSLKPVLVMETQEEQIVDWPKYNDSVDETEATNKFIVKSVSIGPKILRDQDGLLKKLEHKFKPTGFVDWRAMIPKEHLCLNRETFLKKENPIDVLKDLSEEEYQKLLSKADDKDILIKLAGLKELAQIRGYESVRNHSYVVDGRCVVECQITWVSNFETPSFISSGTADATEYNTNGLSSKYLVAIAENRAFARAVRNGLMIHTVSQDEVKFEHVEFDEPTQVGTGPQAVIERKLKDKKKQFNEFHQFLIENYAADYKGIETWENPSDISSADAQIILAKPLGEFLNK